MENQEKKQRKIGDLVKKVKGLEAEMRSADVERRKKMNEIDNEYQPKIKEIHKEIIKTLMEVEKEKMLAQTETEDEALAIGKTMARSGNNLRVSSGQLSRMEEIKREMGPVRSSGGSFKRIWDEGECIWCTGGCLSTCRGVQDTPPPAGCQTCYGECAGSCIGTCEGACGGGCYGTCSGGWFGQIT